MSSPPGTASRQWVWLLDEAAIRDDGGADGIAVPVEAEVALHYAYTPPGPAYKRVLWEAHGASDDLSSPPIQLASSAGWIIPQDGSIPPVFIAHTLMAAVWLIRQSLPEHALPNNVWAQLTHAVSSAEAVATATSADAAATTTPDAAATTTPEAAATKTGTNPAKRAREASEEDTDAGPASEPDSETVATKKKQRKERAQKTRMAKAAARRQAALGLTEPSPEAPDVERHAHRILTSQDEPVVAWIAKQPVGQNNFLDTANLPYATATTMLRCARSIGDNTAKVHAAHFVHNWRRSGHPLLLGNMHDNELVPSSGSPAAAPRTSFQLTMAAISTSESVSAIAGIVYRWGMARLGQRYHEEIALLQAADEAAGLPSGRRAGDGRVRTQAKKAIWDKEQPNMSWSAYNARLKRSVRWFQASQTLGWGFLVLIPTATVTPNWVEQTLRTAEWDIWLRLVEEVNPTAVQASRDFDTWVGPLALQNGSIQGAERLRLEARFESRIHEVADSEGEREEDSESDGGEEGMLSREHVAEDTVVVRSIKLCDLFRPMSVEGAEAMQAVVGEL